MRTRTATAAAVLLIAALTACSDEGGTTAPEKVSPPPSPSASASDIKTQLAPVWTPKLDAAAGPNAEATGACQTPSGSECARYIKEIMAVVDGVDAAINETGKRYPQSTAQIVKMRDARKVYTDEGCEGDPAADDPDSQCWEIMTITVGPATLGMTLMTDDLTSR